MKLLIKLYKKDFNEKMTNNIKSIFKFKKYFKKFSQAKNNENLLLNFFKIKQIILFYKVKVKELKHLKKYKQILIKMIFLKIIIII